jgi:glycosyltransferase involved in cell wall biosynthesis
MPPDIPTFLIVTPSYQSEAFLDETILSVVSQKGPFRIRYHVQDGGSTDGTLRKLERWKAILAGQNLPILCSGVEFTFASAKDSGMYDAINRGFDSLGVRAGDFLTYINSDDRLLPGALEFAAGRFAESAEIEWLGGRPCEINEQGEMMRIHEEQVYPAASLRAGLHDGRAMRFVMQEGTFWRGRLWQEAGAFRTDLRQAGDWDLWRRFAQHATYFTTDTVLACHRRSAKQLTADMGVYYREVDRVIQQETGTLYQAELERFRRWCGASEENWEGRFEGSMLVYQGTEAKGGTGKWEIRQRPYQRALRSSIGVTNGITSIMLPAQFAAGFGPEGSAEPALKLPPGYRATLSGECGLRFDAQRSTLHRIFLRCRNFDAGTGVKLIYKTKTILNAELPMTSHDRDCLVLAEAVFEAGPNVLSLVVTGKDSRKAPAIVVISCEAMSTF